MISGGFKYDIAAKPDFAFFLESETSASQPTKFLAKLVADDAHLGIGKARIQPYQTPWRIQYTKNHFYDEFNGALEAYLTSGQPQ